MALLAPLRAFAQTERTATCPSSEDSVATLLPVPANKALDAGSDEEDNLRLRQVLGCVSLFPISVRAFSRPELVAALGAPSERSATLQTYPARLSLWFNTSRPLSDAQHGVWVGKGTTVAASAGAELRWHAISASLRPWVFVSQNRQFVPNAPNVTPSDFSNGFYPGGIDYPYRFGDGAYGRADLGESWIRADSRFVAVGLSSAAQQWGPARFNPLLLGSSAGGFPHVFLQTGAPLNLWLGRLAIRTMAGRLEPSSVYATDSARLFTGLAASFSPSLFPGLEIGGARVFHSRWPRTGWRHLLLQPLQSFLKQRLNENAAEESAANQLASGFARLVLPAARLELYGEFLRDDHSWDLRDFLAEPEHASAFLLGGRRAWGFSGRDGFAITAEIVNARNPTDFRIGRLVVPIYLHHGITEGHTSRGLPLASPDAFGGGGTTLVIERFQAEGRSAIFWRNHRTGYNQAGGSWNGAWFGAQEIALAHTRRGPKTDWTVQLIALSDWDRHTLSRGSVGISVSAAYHAWNRRQRGM